MSIGSVCMLIGLVSSSSIDGKLNVFIESVVLSRPFFPLDPLSLHMIVPSHMGVAVTRSVKWGYWCRCFEHQGPAQPAQPRVAATWHHD